VKIQALCPGLVRTQFHDALGGRPPGVPVLGADAVVAASLAALALGEVVCLPQLEDATAVTKISEAQQALWNQARASTSTASRYSPMPPG
jgi:uncharacterized protein